MTQGLNQYAAPQSNLANKKMNLAKTLLTLNNARKEQIQSSQDSDKTIAQNDSKIKQLTNDKKSFGLQTTLSHTTSIA